MPKEQVRILIVEDDKSLCPIWEYIANKACHNVEIDWATSELEAEDKIFTAMKENSQYDLLVVDIFLDGPRTGLDLYERFGHLYDKRIIITSGTDYQKYAEYLNDNQNPPYCLEKPLMIDECVKVVSKLLQH